MHILDLAGVPAGYADRPVLEDIHLRVEPGERIAIDVTSRRVRAYLRLRTTLEGR